MSSKAHKIVCPMCEAVSLVEVVNYDDQPEHCPMCGHPVDLDDEYGDEEYED